MSEKAKKKKIQWQQSIGTIFMMLIGAVCGIVMVICADRLGENAPLHQEILFVMGLFIGMYVAFFLHILIHEAGHLIFGLLTGYKFSSFRIFSFIWLKENGKVKFKKLNIPGTAGQCLMIPPDMKDGKFPIVLYNLGGSLINVIAGAFFFVGYSICSDSLFISSLLMIFAVVGFMTAMMNGIPMRMGMVDNDGYNALTLSKNPEALEAFWFQLKLVEQISTGIRLKDMPSEWFTLPSDKAMKNSMVAIKAVFVCNRLMDEERFEDADALMEHILSIDSGITGLHHNLLICDRIFVELITKNRPEVIEHMLTKELKKLMKAMKRYPSILRTEYALALLFEKNTTKAEAIENDFEKSAKSYPYPQEVESEKALIKLVQSKLITQK